MGITETELKERAVAPRVTLDQVNETITSEHYFTAKDGVLGELWSDGIKPSPYERASLPTTLGQLTFCVLVLKNGFTVTGQSACADPANYKKDIDDRIARQDAVNKIWPLLGYELRSQLALIEAGTPPSQPGMQTYVGTKVIHAMPMLRLEYCILRGWKVPADENPLDLGYLVEYADGGKANVGSWAGYVSWSPKDVFEKAYTAKSGS